MKNFYFKKLSKIGSFILFFLILQVIQYSLMFGIAFPIYIFLDILFVLALSSLVLFVKNTIFDKIYLGIWMALFCILTVANVTFYDIFGDIFSLFNLTMVKQGLQIAMDPSYFDFGFISVVVLIYILFMVSLFVIDYLAKRYFRIEEGEKEFSPHKPWKKILIHVSIFAVSVAIYGGALGITCNAEHKDNGNSSIMLTKVSNFKKFGTLSYYLQELDYLINGSELGDEAEMIKYFTKPVDYDNHFTGILKGYNVVNIMIETGDDLMVNQYLTPNLYNVLNNGINCVNNVSKNKTNMSEFIGITGSAPIGGIFADRYDYYLPYSLPNMLNNNGYRTIYIHDVGGEGNENRDIYNRKVLMPKLNFDESYFHEDLLPNQPIWGWNGSYVLDSISMDKAADKILADTSSPFYAFYTSLSMHGPYVRPANESKLRSMYGDKLEQAIEDGKWSNPLKDTINEKCIELYMLAAMDFDKGLGIMLDKFSKAGVLNNTIFVLYGDHEIYYNGADGHPLNTTLSGYEDIIHYDIYNTVMSFYNPKLTSLYKLVNLTTSSKFSYFTSPYNVVPTILDLLGIKYNPNFYIGNSIFSPQMLLNPQLFYSMELSSFFNDDFWTYEGEEIDAVFDETANADSFLMVAKKIMERESYLDMILTNDYFSNHNFSDYNPKQ